MTAAARIEAIRVKVDRARRRLNELSEELSAFAATGPYKVETKRDPSTRRLIYFLSHVAEPPTAIRVLAGEILQSVRSALDHLAYQLVQVGTGTPGPFTHVYFPICADAAKYASQKRSKTHGMRASALAAIDSIQPYRGGNDILWQLDKLNNIDKHRLLIAVGSAYHSVDVLPSAVAPMSLVAPEALKAFESMELFLEPADRMCPLKPGDELFIDMPDAEPRNTKFRFEVAFNEVDVCEGLPIYDTVRRALEEAQRVVTVLEPHLT